MKKDKIKKCPYCGGKGEVEICVFYPVSKMIKIMKKHGLSQVRVASLLGLSQAGVNNWLKPKTNCRGIKKKYFDILEKKGFT